MYLKKIACVFFLLFLFAATATVQSQTIEKGGPDELKGVAKIFVDARTDAKVRERITSEIHKKLRAAKRELVVVSTPEEADIHLRFHYERETFHGEGPGYPGGKPTKVTFGTVVKIL